MWLWFDRSKYDSPVMRSLVVSSIDDYSYVYGDADLNYDDGRLAGVAQEMGQSQQK